jgi:hypothetical protein
MALCLAVTFWGEEYRRYFLDFCLASLLSPGNLPAISDKSSARLFIATNDKDWDALQSEPNFLAAKTFIQIEHVPFEVGAYSSAHEKMLGMSRAHKLLAAKMFKQQAKGIFLYPDMVAADNYISQLQDLQHQGFKVVLFMNVRFANDGLLKELRQNDLVRPGVPLALSPRQLVRLTLRHMHSEMRRSGFDDPYDDYGCSSYFWRVGQDDLLFHCGNWVPALIDYGAINAHDDTTFDSSTLDADYVAKNLSISDRVHFVRDTDELFMISFTPESTVRYSLARTLAYRFPPLRTSLKIIRAHHYLYWQGTLDWLRKAQFPLPIRFRGGNAPEDSWRKVESRAAAIVERIERSTTAADRLIYACYCIVTKWRGYSIAIRTRLPQMARGDREAWQRVGWRLREFGRWLAGHSAS